jgi:transposase
MLTLPPTVRVFIGLDPIDMRRSFDALAAQVSARLARDPLDGHLYCFVNRARTMMKVLFFDRSGYCILYKRLEVGTFTLPKAPAEGKGVELSPAELGLILEGIDLSAATRRKRYQRAEDVAGRR